MAKTKSSKGATPPGSLTLIDNRKARFNYEIVDSIEAGIVLEGWEIKSLRAGNGNLNEAYVRGIKNEIFVIGMHISPYAFTHLQKIDPVRKRKLLLHRREIAKLLATVAEKGMTLVPLKMYLKKGRAKLLLGVGKGKKMHDKRQSMKEREAKRDIDRAMKQG
jgi:SsrA-binding protein